jgi:hypothetical protein
MRRVLVQISTVLFAAVLAVGLLLGAAIPAVACSCIEPQPMAVYAGDADQVVFTGIVQPPDPRGVPVRVTRWFQGPDTSAIVWLDSQGFTGDGASCGTALPPAGTEWIFVAYRSDGRELGVNMCTPHAPASAVAGQAMFADAIATFGEGVVMDPAPGPPTTTPAASDGLPLPLPLLIATGIGVLGFIAGLALLRRPGRKDRADQV